MPRNAPRPQQPAAPTGQDYGDHQEQIAAQRQMPLPDMHAAGGSTASPAGATGGGMVDPASGQPLDPEAILAAATGMAAPEPPPWAAGPVDEPVTHGLPSGPGPGPESLRMVRGAPLAPVADMLQRLADATGDPYYAELAQIAGE